MGAGRQLARADSEADGRRGCERLPSGAAILVDRSRESGARGLSKGSRARDGVCGRVVAQRRVYQRQRALQLWRGNYKIPAEAIEKRDRLRAVADKYGVNLRTAALQFSLAPDVAFALIVGCSNAGQALADFTSVQTNIPTAFWSALRSKGLIESDAATPTET